MDKCIFPVVLFLQSSDAFVGFNSHILISRCGITKGSSRCEGESLPSHVRIT
jgi:hypothetical protein